MYLSKLLLNPRSRLVQNDLSDFVQMHRTVLSAFPDNGKTTSFRSDNNVLYRVDIRRDTGVPVLLVQSGREPDWEVLAARRNYLVDCAEPNPQCKRLDTFLQRLVLGQMLAFRLRANVTRKIDTKSGPDGKKNNGRRVPLRQREEQIEWLRRKAEQGGFELPGVPLAPEIPDVIVRQERDLKSLHCNGGFSKQRITLASVLFDGRLRITDLELFKQTLARGVGSAKAFGFGLLSVAPI